MGLASLRGRRGRVGARVWAALLGLVPMLSVVPLSDAVSLSVVYRDPFFRIFGIYQRMYLYLYINMSVFAFSTHGRQVYHLLKASISSFEGMHIIF